MTSASQPQRIAEATIWLANRKLHIKGAEERYFKELGLIAGSLAKLKEREIFAYQSELRTWLSKIAEDPVGARKEMGRDIAKYLDKVPTRTRFQNDQVRYEYDIDSVPTAFALGLAHILDHRHGWTTRLKKCKNEDCHRFHLAFKPRGRPSDYCSAKCKSLYSRRYVAARMRKYRGGVARD
jgi:hypothetical protein